jgi:prophage regulatory protein
MRLCWLNLRERRTRTQIEQRPSLQILWKSSRRCRRRLRKSNSTEAAGARRYTAGDQRLWMLCIDAARGAARPYPTLQADFLELASGAALVKLSGSLSTKRITTMKDKEADAFLRALARALVRALDDADTYQREAANKVDDDRRQGERSRGRPAQRAEEPPPELLPTDKKPPLDLLKAREVKERTSLGISTIYKKMEEGTFPKPWRMSPGCVRWFANEIDEWIERGKISRGT